MGSIFVTKALLFLLLFCNVSSDTEEVSTAPMERAQQEALYSVIRGFVGNGWNGSELYPDPCGWTPIQGISCDIFNGFWYVTSIDIGPLLENSLQCSPDAKFSSSLADLTHLKTLSVYNCFSSIHQPMTMPSLNWEKLAGSLETLEFRSNRGLFGQLPTSLGQLRNLQSLVLVDNALSGGLPPELAGLVHLKRMVLAGNQLSGHIPAYFCSNMTELLIFDLSRNSFAGSIPSSFGCLQSLIKLDLSHNSFNGKLPTELGKLKNLTLLDLRHNNLSGGLSDTLQDMVAIEDILLSNNPLGGDLMKLKWENLRNLATLDLSNMELSGSIPESIAELERLRFLALDNNHLTGIVPPKLGNLASLNALYLSGNNLTGEVVFPGDFYQRMGRRFAAWNNPSLCYTAEGIDAQKIPVSLPRCKIDAKEVPGYNSDADDNKVGNGSFLASFGFSVSCIKGLRWLIFVQELVVVVFLFVLVL